MVQMKALIPAMVIGAFLLCAPVSFGKFSSPNKESKGTGESIDMTLEAGGGVVKCHAYAESQSAASWTIESEGKPAIEGPALVLHVEKWGECTASSGLLEETKAEVTGCELELTEPEEQVEVSAKVLTACKVKVATCEVAVEPSENTSLKSVDLGVNGKSEENLIVDPAIKNVATTLKGLCLGVKATKEGKLTGLAVANMVQIQARAEFIMEAKPHRLTGAGQMSTVTVARIRGAAGVGHWSLGTHGPLPPKFVAPGFEDCIGMSYTLGGTPCEFKVEYGGGAGVFEVFVVGAAGTPFAEASVEGV